MTDFNGVKNKTKNLIYVGGALVGLAIIIAVMTIDKNKNDRSGGAKYSAGVIAALENNFDFDTISMSAGKVSHRFEIQNNGAEPVRIEKVFTSCMCTTAFIADSAGNRYGEFGMPGHGHSSSPKTNIEVKPGETVFVDAVFDPAAHGPSGVGLAERSVYLETNSRQSPKIELLFRATVTR